MKYKQQPIKPWRLTDRRGRFVCYYPHKGTAKKKAKAIGGKAKRL